MSSPVSPSHYPWEDWLRLLLESATDHAIFSTDLQRRINFWSVGAARMFQYQEEEVLGKSSDIIFTPEDRANGVPEREVQEAATKGRAADERWHLRSGGQRFFASGVVTPLRDDAFATIGFVKIARDLTASRIADLQLQLAHAELEKRVEIRTAELKISNAELLASNTKLRREVAQRKRAEKLRREAIRRIADVQEEEQRRIAREIHDELGQLTAGLLLGLNTLQQTKPELAGRIAELQEQAQTLAKALHKVAVQVRPTAIEDMGLARALESYCRSWSKRSGIVVELVLDHMKGARLSDAIEVATFRIVQEALTNIVKHAGAQRVGIVAEIRGNELLVSVEDNGRGFEPGPIVSAGRLGILGMSERAKLYGGRVSIESELGRGTTVYIRMPYSNPLPFREAL